MNYSINASATLTRLPNFAAIAPASLTATLKDLLAGQRERLREITAEPQNATWASVVGPMEIMADELHRFFSPVSHLHNVADSEALRQPYNACIAMISEFSSELNQDSALCACYKAIRARADFKSLGAAKCQVVENALRDFRLGGVDLAAAKQAEVKQLQIELAGLTTRFEENVLDATQAFRLNVTDAARLAGLPPGALALARSNAEKDGHSGWTLSLDLPCYVPAMSHLQDRELRHTLHRAYVTRASDVQNENPEHDNSAVMRAIVSKRQALAQALGFATYSDLSLATKMAPTSASVVEFLNELAAQARPAAQAELHELTVFASAELGIPTLEAWDIAYCSEQLRRQKFNFSQEDLRPYFPVERVISGMFKVAGMLFDIVIEQVREPVQTWHEDVGFYAVSDAAGELLGFFYLDIFARTGKRSGAWMDECLTRWRQAEITQLPVAYLNCNFTPPNQERPTLLTHDEVTTLFHEFGHGLHHMLTRIEQPPIAGINGVPWDAVELPSQIMENWCWEREALNLIGAHHSDGHAIPPDLYDKLRSAQRFQAAMQTLRQVELALFDFRLHMEFSDDLDVQALLDDVRKSVAVVPVPPWNRFQHSFTHIFAGGYAAGYYSYKWAEVLAADAYSRFEDEGLFNRETGLDFRRTILERGGAEDALELFKRFRGREPSVDPLLRRAGLIA